MRHNLELHPRYGAGLASSLSFTLDDETLALGGRDAEAVAGLLRAAAAAGSVTIDPYPTTVAIDDPFIRRDQFAAVLAERYALPDWLQDWADNGESEQDFDDDAPEGLTY